MTPRNSIIFTLDDFLKLKLMDYKKVDGIISGYMDDVSFDTFFKDLKALGYMYFKCGVITYTYERISYQCTGVKQGLQRTPSIPFFGMPFTDVSVIHHACSYYHKKYQITQEGKSLGKKKYCTSKKFGCAAWMIVKCIRFYPDFKLPLNADNWRAQQETSCTLRAQLKSSSPPVSVLRYYLTASEAASHLHGKIGLNLMNKTCRETPTRGPVLNPARHTPEVLRSLTESDLEVPCKPSTSKVPYIFEEPSEPSARDLPTEPTADVIVRTPEEIDLRLVLQEKYSLIGELLTHVKDGSIPQITDALDRIISDISIQLIPYLEVVAEITPRSGEDLHKAVEMVVSKPPVESVPLAEILYHRIFLEKMF